MIDKLHDRARFNVHDLYFVSGRNPTDDGGGVIGSARTLLEARALQLQAIEQNYSHVTIKTWKELYK